MCEQNVLVTEMLLRSMGLVCQMEIGNEMDKSIIYSQ